MLVACFDLEGVFVPEVWIEVAKITGIEELKLTTRDIKDYDELMQGRLKILRENGIGLEQIQEVIAKIKPIDGAREFIDWVKSQCQVVILSDTFYEFAEPLMVQLGHPTLFCHSLVVDEKGNLADYKLRDKDSKRQAVLAFRSLGFSTLACGDSYNDVSMIKEADKGFFFKSPENIRADFPGFEAFDEYDDLKQAVEKLLKSL